MSDRLLAGGTLALARKKEMIVSEGSQRTRLSMRRRGLQSSASARRDLRLYTPAGLG